MNIWQIRELMAPLRMKVSVLPVNSRMEARSLMVEEPNLVREMISTPAAAISRATLTVSVVSPE